MYKRGNAMGRESKDLGIHVQLAPVAGPLGKLPAAGRNWEGKSMSLQIVRAGLRRIPAGFSSDPYLTGMAMFWTIHGMQDAGVQACAKHLVGNEQENGRKNISSNIDDRTMHEVC